MKINFKRQRESRKKLRAAIRRGTLGLIDIGSSKIVCLILKFAKENEGSELTSLDQIKNDDMLVIYLRYIHIPETLTVSVEWAGSGKILTNKLFIRNNRSLEYLLCKIHELLPQESLSNNKWYDFKNHRIFVGHGGPDLISLDQIKNGDTLVILPGYFKLDVSPCVIQSSLTHLTVEVP